HRCEPAESSPTFSAPSPACLLVSRVGVWWCSTTPNSSSPLAPPPSLPRQPTPPAPSYPPAAVRRSQERAPEYLPSKDEKRLGDLMGPGAVVIGAAAVAGEIDDIFSSKLLHWTAGINKPPSCCRAATSSFEDGSNVFTRLRFCLWVPSIDTAFCV
ncbi:unnamed protein product, partial [Ectocarpus sp. 13 AM-2016]